MALVCVYLYAMDGSYIYFPIERVSIEGIVSMRVPRDRIAVVIILPDSLEHV